MTDETIELTEVQAVLDGLSSPTDEQLVQAVRGYSDGAVASAAAKLAMAGGGGGSLPAGWTQVGDPADVFTNGGSLTLGGELDDETLQLATNSIALSNAAGALLQVTESVGVNSSPSDSVECFQANDMNGATVALGCADLPITSLADPTDPQDAATKNYVDANASLPAWWTVDSTPGSESVEFAGDVIVSGDNVRVDQGGDDTTEMGAGVLTLGNSDTQNGLHLSDDPDLTLFVNGSPVFAVAPTGAVTISPSDDVIAQIVNAAAGQTVNIAEWQLDGTPLAWLGADGTPGGTLDLTALPYAPAAAGVPDATGAASGDVLTADGIGGFAWVTP